MANFLEDLGVKEILAGQSILSRPAEEFGNDQVLEMVWATKAFEHAEVYMKLLTAVEPKSLKLTPHDDNIYSTFRENFPNFNVEVLNEDDIKSDKGKAEWRSFCEKFKGVVEDFDFGTLIRSDCKGEYSQENSILVLRIQFYAIEIARNREGYNDEISKKLKAQTDKK